MSPKSAPKPITDLTPRLEAAAREVKSDESALRGSRERRRQLVHQAIEEGMPYRAIGRALGGGTGMVSKIAADPGPDEE